MRVLVACEYSGTVRDAFIKRGHEAVSCDLLPTDAPGPHYQGDVFDIINEPWDLIIAHPPCTYMSNSGVRWLGKGDTFNYERWAKLFVAISFFNSIKNFQGRICLENPIPHKYATKGFVVKNSDSKGEIKTNGIGVYDQIIQPWQFGHGETKATCLWLKNLPKLEPTNVVEGREQKIWKMAPSETRAKLRSKTYQGIAEAMAEQWGN